MTTMIPERSEEWREELKRRAAAEGLTISEFLLREAESNAPPISRKELIERLKSRSRIDIGMSGADLVREGRKERLQYLDEIFDDLLNRR